MRMLVMLLICAALAFLLLWAALGMHDPTLPIVRPETAPL
jgi:hypothetical protein